MSKDNIHKKILLVYPEIPPTYWSFKYALPFIDKKASIPPLGLITVAAMLPSSYEVSLIDMNISPLKDEMIAEADLVFTSAMIVQKDSLARVAERCQKLQVPLVAGGPYPSSSYNKIDNVDYFVLNEAEVTLPQFLYDLERGQAKHIYQDVRKADITTTQPPRFDLLSLQDYATMPLQYSRGCPFNCEFCDIIEMFGHTMRTKTIQQMIDEFNILHSLGWRGSVFIVDDNFIGNKKNVKQLLPAIADWQKQRNYPFDLFTEASINLADDEDLLELMSKAGFNMVFIGIETPDKETLITTGKQQNVRQDLFGSVIKIQNQGIEVAGGFIIGFDNDQPDIFERQIQFIQKSGIPLAMVGLLTALPNTQLYRRLEKEGRLLEDSTGNNTHDLHLNFKPKMDMNTIIHGYKQIISHIYNPRVYFDRCLNFLRNVHPHQNSARRVRMEEVLAFFRSLIKQGLSSYGHHYLGYLIKAMVIEPSMFPEAVRQAIMGFHFFKITQEILAVDNFKSRANRIKALYLERLRDTYMSFDIEKKVAELKIVKENLLKDLQREYQKIDEDFRHLVEETLLTLENTLNIYYKQWLDSMVPA
ncbi:MAG: B12-binding domain-containing radical SAM protein [bacterium]